MLTSSTDTIEKHIRLRNRPHEAAENMVRRFRLIDAEFRRLAPKYPNTVVINRDGREFHDRAGLTYIIDAAGLPPFHLPRLHCGRLPENRFKGQAAKPLAIRPPAYGNPTTRSDARSTPGRRARDQARTSRTGLERPNKDRRRCVRDSEASASIDRMR